MNRRLLDLFCGAGGASKGYVDAGFEVVGVDIAPQPDYPYEFIQAGALGFLANEPVGFTAIHASPPCQRWSALNNGRWGNASGHPDLVTLVRELLRPLGLPYIIENVPSAPLVDPIVLCGSMFDLRLDDPPGYLRRHRLFETNFPLAPPRGCRHSGQALGVYGHGAGGGPLKGRTLNAERAREIMEMPWATRDGCSQAIPPAYTRWIGTQLLAYLNLARAR